MKRVLIIDDDTDMCQLLSHFLKRKGFETDTAHTGNKGLQKFKEREFDVVLCDFRLGDWDGRKVLIELKKEAYFSEAEKIARQVAFVDSGILRVCYYNNKGEEKTRYFIDENNFAVDLNSFTYQIPSSEYVQAVTDCKLLIFSADGLKDLSMTIIFCQRN